MWSPPGQNRHDRKKRRAEIADDPDFSANVSLSGIPDQLRRPLELVGDAYLFGRSSTTELWRLDNAGFQMRMAGGDFVQAPWRFYTSDGRHLIASLGVDPLANDGSEVDVAHLAMGTSSVGWSAGAYQRWDRQVDLVVSSTNAQQEFFARLIDGPAPGPDYCIRFRRIGSGALQGSFFGAEPTERPVITGSRSSGAVLNSLINALNALGLIIDQTTP